MEWGTKSEHASLQSLGLLIEAAWEGEGPMQEYQRMAVLAALAKIGSASLGDYLQRAETDGRQYLQAYAATIRAGQNE